ncbi:MAG: 2-phospho-L-lactate guanylyltransferase [Microthrixaceae bacterium]
MGRDGQPDDSLPKRAQLLMPVKGFDLAKQRLAAQLEPVERSRLARAMADTVLRAASPLPVVVVCDDDGVRRWALDAGASVCWTPGCDLNAALTKAVDEAAVSGIDRVVIAHADLPFAAAMERLAAAATAEVLLVPDRHGRGTNVMSIPTDVRFPLSYGPDSRSAHVRHATSAGLSVTEIADAALGWDVDEPADLNPPAALGELPAALASCPPTSGN